MKRRVLCLLLAVIMVFGLLPTMALADDEQEPVNPPAQATTVEVDFTAQTYGAFLCAPQFGVEVSSNLAESYGYTDSVTGGVSALDVLVKAHEIIFGEDFDADTTDEFLTVNNGWVGTAFAVENAAFGFAVNGEYPADRSGTYGQYGYTGYMIHQAPISDGSNVEFFLYQDTDMWMDYYAYFLQDGQRVTDISAIAGADIALAVEGYMYAFGGAFVGQDRVNQGDLGAIEDAQLAWVNIETGELTDIEDAVTDEDGEATVTAPDEAGTYYLTAYMPAEEIEENYATPIVMTMLEVTVTEGAAVQDVKIGRAHV